MLLDAKLPGPTPFEKCQALRRAARSPFAIFVNFVAFPLFALALLWKLLSYDLDCLWQECSSVDYRAHKILKKNPLIGRLSTAPVGVPHALLTVHRWPQ